ncbi:MAG: hypothetical protein H6995_14370 [Pseudomonadales bacterium]|nr:hypothetical protein [Pseudomonadales bacterium]MCP5216185.1 hypothetical protein [Pseudomonadales bacterium]
MADYLLLRPSGYHFHYVIPSRFKRVFHQREIKFALTTHHKARAKREARKLVVCAEEVLRFIAEKQEELIDYFLPEYQEAMATANYRSVADRAEHLLKENGQGAFNSMAS